MVHEPAAGERLSLMKGLVESIENEGCPGRA